MRIAYVLAGTELNGGHKVVVQHAALLTAIGHSVTILAPGPRPGWMESKSAYADLTTPSADRSFDLVIATYWTTVAVAERLHCGPVVHFCQGFEEDLEHLAPAKQGIAAEYRKPMPALVVAPHLALRLKEQYARDSMVVSPPLDRHFRPGLRWKPRKRPWIAVPGIYEAPVKNVGTALEAVKLLRREGLECRVFRFSGLPLSNEERSISPPDVYLHGASPSAIARGLRRCDLLLFASRPGEGFGLPLLEALASQVPAVASRIPSTEYMCRDAVRLVSSEDAEAFASAAFELLTNAPHWREARSNGAIEAERFSEGAIELQLQKAVTWLSSSTVQANCGEG